MQTEDKLTRLEKEELDQENLLLKVLILLFGIIAILLLTRGFMFGHISRNENTNNNVQNQVAEEQKIKNLIISKVGALIVLPNGEPQIATVTDADLVRKESGTNFFENAQNGDVLLVYPSVAIMYNPRLNKIINVGPVQTDLSAKSGTEEQVAKKQEKPTLEIRNGTRKQGYAGQMKEKIGGLAIVKATNTTEIKTYKGNILVKKMPDFADLDFGLTPKPVVSELPKGEKPFSTDYLLILGN